MNPIVFAMRHPITQIMLVVTLVLGGSLALSRMRMDIFPSINQPEIFVFCNFGGMDPGQMEGLMVNQFEISFQYVDGVRTIESKCIQQVAVIKIAFYADTDMAKAMAMVVSEATRAQATMPPDVLPPLIMQFDAGSVPVGYLVLQSKTRSLGAMGDLAQVRIRALVQANVPGTVATSPFGTNARSIVISVDPDRLRSYNFTPEDVVKAVHEGNVISPSGNLYILDQMPLAPNNAMIEDPLDFGTIPIKVGQNVYVRDVATIADATDVDYGCALVNGVKSVYLPIVKKGTASTLQVVSDIHKAMPRFKGVLPEDVDINFEFDESPTVMAAISNVGVEGLIGAALTGLMILLFLRDWRSVFVVVSNIPLALLGSVLGLWLTGNTLNVMTLGGLALATGILVDESTVSLENVHAQMAHTNSIARAALLGNNITAVPRLLALMCILSVFVPAFIMAEPVRSLFLPLALAVGFAMIASYFLSSMYVPVISVWLLKHHGHHTGASALGWFGTFQVLFGNVVGRLVKVRWVVVPAYFLVCAAILAGLGTQLGRELFPQVDSGQFVLRVRAPPGTNYEITRQIANKALQVIEDEAGEGSVEMSMGFAGQQAPVYCMNNLILFMHGPDDAQLRIALKEGRVHLAEFREKLRQLLPEKVRPWLIDLLRKVGLSPIQAKARADQLAFGFEPGDVVSKVMSFGAPTPIEVMVMSPNLADAKMYAMRVKAEMEKIASLRDVQFQQTLDYPTIPVRIDREKAGLSGLTAKEVADSITMTTSSSRYVARNYWRDPTTGIDYQVEVVVPPPRMNSAEQVETLPLRTLNGGELNLLVRDVAKVGKGTMPGEYDRSTMQRYLSLTANIEGEDLGRAVRHIENAIAEAGEKPHGVNVRLRGQIAPMREMFQSLMIGLAIAVVAILILLTAYFESLRLALAAVSAVPGVLSGVVLMLYCTHTSLNIESFMGSIMCIGVSISNSVMLVTFIAMEWQKGLTPVEAARSGAQERLRPILMTACAMTVGMVPMALALEHGSEMQAPLGRAVIGGLVFSTFVTLFVVPSLFALIMGKRKAVSASLLPDDPESSHYDPFDPNTPQADHGGQAAPHHA
jgi:multidrug efflux pump subunit AcrB